MTFTSEGGAFHAVRPGLCKLLGDFKADIMEAVWARGERLITVRDILSGLEPKRGLAYTTVMTVMGALAKKGILKAEKAGKAHLYRATYNRHEFTEAAVARIVDELVTALAPRPRSERVAIAAWGLVTVLPLLPVVVVPLCLSLCKI
jgi:predicted transcriptional regulator